MATYFMRADGTAANKEAATGPAGTVSACMNMSVHNGETFSAGDVIMVSDQGGVYRAQGTPPTSGSSGNPVTYQAVSGESPTWSGADAASSWSEVSQVDESGGLGVADAESGDLTDFSSTNQPGSSTIAATTTARRWGSYGYEYTWDGSNAGMYGAISVSTPTDTYVRLYIKVDSSFSLPNFNELRIISFSDGGVQRASVRINKQTGATDYRWRLLVGATQVYFGSSAEVVFDTWYRVEVHFKVDGSVGGAQLWVDGTSLGSDFTLNTDTHEPSEIRIGNDGSSNNPAASSKVFFDNIKVATSAIGAFAGTEPHYSATFTSAPSEVYADATQLTQGASATTLGEDEWFHNSGTLYVRLAGDADPDSSTVEGTVRSKCIELGERDYVTIDGLTFDKSSGNGISIIQSSQHRTDLTIQNCTVTNAASSGISVGGGAGSHINPNSVTIDTCTITNWFRGGSTSVPAIKQWAGDGNGGDDFVVRDCTITGDVAFGSDTNNGRDGVEVQAGDNIILEGNTITGCDHGLKVTASVETFTIRNNTVHDTGDDGIWIDSPTGTDGTCHGNVLYNLSDNGFDLRGTYGTVYNNTIYNALNEAIIITVSGTTGTVKNNAIMDWGTYAISIGSSAVNANQTFDYNVYFDTGSDTFATVEGTERTFSAWQSTHSQDANGANDNPDFVDAGGDDFHLTSVSPCVAGGVDLSIATDRDGAEYDDPPSVGAYEYPGSSASQSTATVPSTAQQGASVSVTVQAKDVNGSNITDGGDTVVISVTGANTATPTVTDVGDGTYTASYTATNTGSDSVAITLNGVAISGSAYTVTVNPEGTSASEATTVGTSISLSVSI